MLKRLIIVIAALVVVFGGIFGWKAFVAYKTQDYLANMKPPAVTVSSTTVSEQQWQVRIPLVGQLDAIQGIRVSTEVPGKIASITFESGQHVEAGTVLVELDASAEKALLRSLRAELKLAQLDLERARDLLKTAAVSQAQLDRAQSQMEKLQGEAEEQAALVEKKTIRAPFSGELGIRRVDMGEYVPPGTEIVSLQQLDPILVNFSLPERFAPYVMPDQPLDIEVAAFPGRAFEGVLTAVSPEVDVSTRVIRLQGSLPNPEGLLRPGMFAKIEVVRPVVDSVITVPYLAVSFFPYGDSVFIINEKDGDLVVERKQIKTGRIRDGMVEVLEGLEAGQRIVHTGHLKLRTGQRIEIDNSVPLPPVVGTP
ncbi:MAG: efflux RND transporter periplasmic adaptor subunit [Alphaproteobacteria bacterium]|nr:efflux RND transporter periplasmic adaptor subunit [Alphaproteobacteria bacterium]